MKPFLSHQLKIKVVSLGLEAALIHREECKLKTQIARCKAKITELTESGDNSDLLNECRKTLVFLRAQRDSLREHRKRDIRPLTRDAALAYGFLRGKAYSQIEPKRYTDPNFSNIEKMIERHGKHAGNAAELKARFAEWKAAAPEKAVLS